MLVVLGKIRTAGCEFTWNWGSNWIVKNRSPFNILHRYRLLFNVVRFFSNISSISYAIWNLYHMPSISTEIYVIIILSPAYGMSLNSLVPLTAFRNLLTKFTNNPLLRLTLQPLSLQSAPIFHTTFWKHCSIHVLRLCGQASIPFKITNMPADYMRSMAWADDV